MFEKALTAEKRDFRAFLDLGRCSLRLSLRTRALRILERTLKTVRCAGKDKEKLRERYRAERMMRAAVVVSKHQAIENPNQIQHKVRLAEDLLDCGLPEPSLEVLEGLLQRGHDSTWLFLARVWTDLREFSAAEFAARRAMRVEEVEALAKMKLADVYYAAGRYREALAASRLLLEDQDIVPALLSEEAVRYRIALCLYSLGQKQALRKECKRIEANTSGRGVYVVRARSMLEILDRKEKGNITILRDVL